MNEYLLLHDELESFEFVDFEPELANKWLQHENQSQHINQQLAELTDENDGLEADEQNAAGNSSGMNWIVNHPNVSEQMVVEARAFRDRMRQNEEFSQELIERRYEKQRLMSLLGAEEMAELPDELTADERSYWQQRYKELENRRIFYNHSQSDMTSLSEKASSWKMNTLSYLMNGMNLRLMADKMNVGFAYWVVSLREWALSYSSLTL